MRRIVYGIGLAAALCMMTNCDRYSSENGDLDGFWLLSQTDTLATGGSANVRGQLLTYSVYTDVLQLRGRTEINLRFRHTGDSLLLYEPYSGGWGQPDNVLEDVSLLYPYGISRLQEAFRIELLRSHEMVLKSKELRLHFVKY